jgi:molybdate transport system regulatory protein
MTVGDQSFGGPGRIELLARILETGSITRAAAAMKMSYRAAWDAIDRMNNLAGEPLVERRTGGRGGGATLLTPRGEQLVANFRIIEEEHDRYVQRLSRSARDLKQERLLIKTLSMRTSARNQYLGRVAALRVRGTHVEVALAVGGGIVIHALIARESCEHLGLATGSTAFALVEASAVRIAGADPAAGSPQRNRFVGTVARLRRGAATIDVVLDLPGAGTIASVVAKDSVTGLDLRVGRRAAALVEDSSVIVGVPA